MAAEPAIVEPTQAVRSTTSRLPPPIVHRWLIALSLALVVAWLGFLLYLALRAI
ncbi:MAG: hypothetical protein ACR2NU_02600 [Aeoliella sp.]